MKNKILLIPLAISLLLAGCNANGGNSSESQTSSETETVVINDKENIGDLPLHREKQLIATVSPNSATNKTVVWESSDTSVATVDDRGIVKGIKQGTTTITAKIGEESDSVDITVTDPTINVNNSGLPVSYKAEFVREYEETVIPTGKSESDAFDFKQDSFINVDALEIPTMNVLESDFSAAVYFVKFRINVKGNYYLFANGGQNASGTANIDNKLDSLKKIDEDGSLTKVELPSSTDDRDDKDPIACKYTATNRDFFVSQELDVGTYVATLRLFATRGDFKFGVVNVVIGDEGDTKITSAVGEPEVLKKQETHQFEFVKGKAALSINEKTGYYIVNNEAHGIYYQEEEAEWAYENDVSSEITVESLNNDFSWQSILADAALKYLKTSEENNKTIDVFVASIDDLSESSNINKLLFMLGLKNYVSNFLVTIDVDSDSVLGLDVELKEDDNAKPLNISPIDDLSFPINHYDVPNGGEAGDDSGINQDW